MSSNPEQQILRSEKLSPRRIVVFVVVFIIAAVAIGFLVSHGIQARVATAGDVQQETAKLSVPTVAIVHPKPGEPSDELVLSGALAAFTQAQIYARASGYIKKWNVNLGDSVKENQVLAEIEAPELDLQFGQAEANLQQTRASVAQAEANLQQGKANESLAKITADRNQQLTDAGILAAQANDQSQAQYKAQIANSAALVQAVQAGRSSIASQEANLASLDQLRSYRTVRAPFDGVVTARNTDVGALVNAAAQTTPLFQIASVEKLRLFVSVPEVYSAAAVPGLAAELTLQEYPNRRFPARLVRTSGAIDSATRTLLSEFEVNNSSGALRPGSYAEVHLALKSAAKTLLVPVSAVMFRPEGARVGIVDADGRAKLAPVALGKDYGTVVEVLSGVNLDDQIIESPPDSLSDGTTVHTVEAKSTPKGAK